MADTITITLKDVVRGNTAMRVLSGRQLKGSAAYLISKAARQVNPLVEDYQKGLRGIMEDAGAKPDESGALQFDPTSKGYKKGRDATEKYEKKHFDEAVTVNVRKMKLSELLEAIPPVKDKEGKEIQEGGLVEPFILEGIGWLIEE